MGFLTPNLPTLDMEEWNGIPRGEKIRRMAAHWAESGAGTPTVLHGFYLVKIVLYVLGGWSFALATKGIDGFTDVGSWWSEPIVFEKVVLYTMLFEVIGLGLRVRPAEQPTMATHGINPLLVAPRARSGSHRGPTGSR